VGVDQARAGQRAHAAGLDRPRHTAAPPSFLPTRILDLLQAGVVGPGVKRPLRPAPRMRQLRVGHGVQLSAEVVEAVLRTDRQAVHAGAAHNGALSAGSRWQLRAALPQARAPPGLAAGHPPGRTPWAR
jgi:hypothetical protein